MRGARCWRLLRETGFILLLSLAMGSVYQVVSPGAIPWAGQWSTYMERQARSAGLGVVETKMIRDAEWPPVLLDARRMDLYGAGRIPGAMPMPEKGRRERLAALLPALEQGEPLVVYCAGRTCDEALVLGRQLREAGFTAVAVYVGGYEAWCRAGLEVERDSVTGSRP